MSDIKQFTAVHRYCIAEGFTGGFLSGDTFKASNDFFWNIGIIQLINNNNDGYETEDIEETLLPLTSVEDMINKANKLPRVENGEFIGALPMFERGMHDNNVAYEGVIYIKKTAGEIKNIPVSDLIEFVPDIVTSPTANRFHAVNRYLHKEGIFVGGIPTFTEELPLTSDSEIKVIAIYPDFGSHTGIPDIHFQAQFYTYTGFNWNDEFFIRQGINNVIRSIKDSEYLTEEEKLALIHQGIKKPLTISPSDSTPGLTPLVGGNEFRINLDRFPNRNTKATFESLCQTIIHELMHVAGETHVLYQDSFAQYQNAGCTNNTHIPAAAFEYWNSAPLRAECTINNTQNLWID